MEGEKKISSAEQEIEMLRKRIAELESVAAGKERHEIIKEAIKEHREKIPEQVLSQDYQMPREHLEQHAKRISDLSQEPEHQRHIHELLRIADEKGVLNAISIVEKINDPHLEDDFHDALIRHLQETHNV